MDLELITSQVVGLSNESLWSQTMVEGNFISTIEIRGDGYTPVKDEAGVFLTGLLEIIGRHKPQEKEAFRRIVSQYIENSPVNARIISLVVGLRNLNNLFIYCHKNGSAVLKRGDLWSEVVKGEGLAVGQLLENDLLVFTTPAFNKLLPHDRVINRFTMDSDPQTTGERIGALLHNFDDSKGAAAVFAVFRKPLIDEATPLNGEISIEEKPTDPLRDELKNTIPGLNVEVVEDLPLDSTDSQIEPSLQIPNESQDLTQPVKENVAVNQEVEGNISPVIPPVNLPPVAVPAPVPKIEKPSILSKLTNIFPKKQLKEETVSPNISLKKSPFTLIFASPKKRVLTIALFLIGLLGASFFISTGKTGSPSNSAVANQIESITFKVEEGEALSDLNTLRAKSSLTEAEKLLQALIPNLKKGTKERIEADSLLTRTQNALGVVSKSYRITPSIFADLSVVKSGAKGDGMAIYEDTIAVLDKTNTSIMTVNSQGSVAIVGGGADTPNPKNIAIHGSSIFTLTDKGLVRTETGSKRQQVIVSNVSEIGSVADMVGYAGNVYILDSGNKKIWKFAPSGNSFTSARPYLAENETIPMTISKMAIDGSVWVLGENRIKKYVRGTEEFVNIEGLDTSLMNATDIFIDDISKYLYIYDAGTHRVVVLEKDGTYNSEYIVEGVSEITDIVVSESQKKAFLLSGNSIYSVDLRIETEEE